MKTNTMTKQQLLLEVDELRGKLDTTEQSLQEAKEVLEAKITEHKRAEENLEKAQKYAQSIVETIREPLLVLSSDLKVIFANRSFYQTFTVTPEETEGRFIYSIGNRQWDIPVLRELLEEIIPKNTHFNDFKVDHEFPVIGRRTMLLNARRIYREGKGTEMILLAIEDVTERTQWEEALKISETRYRRLFETAQDGILILDADTGQISHVNPFLIKMLGYSHGDFLGKKLWEIGAFRDIEASRAAFLELQNKGYVRYEHLPLKSKDGRLIDVEFVSNTYLVNHKKVIQCNIRDITISKQAEKKLKQAAEEWEVMFDSIKDLVSIHDKDFKIVKANKAFVDTLGLESGEVIGRKCYEVIHGTEEPWLNCPHKQTMGSKTPVTEEFWEPRLGIYLQVSSSPIFNDRNEVLGIVHIAKDITERKRAEEALEVSNRFLQITNKQMEMTPLLKEFLVEIRNLTGCSAVGVRLLDDAGNIPYQAYEGFSQEFYQKESPLSIKSDQCMCINVIKGEIDPALPFYTAGGSFYINATSRFLATVSEKEKGKTRNECNRIGFESVALVPIPIGDGIHGLIHVADPRENMVPLEMVELLERVSMQLGTGIHRVRAEEALQKAHNELEIRVQERTAELLSVVSALQDEMAERKQAEEALRKANYDLNERIKEINCLYSISYYVEKQYLLLEEKLKNIVDLIPSGCQYPEITCARIILEDKEYRTDNFKKTTWKQFSDIILRDEKIGTIEVFYLEKKPEDYEGPFLKQERGLINAIAIELREMTAHMRAEKALVEQSRILEAFFTSTITPFVLLDKNFNYVRVNEAYAKACQRDISEFPGHNHFEYYPSAAKNLFEHVVETKAPYQALARPFTFPDHPEWGVTYWNWTLTPILDSRGEVEFLVFSLQDVTERKRAQDAVEAERQRFNEVLEILPAYLVLLAPDYQVPFANRFFRERFGESQGRRCFEYLFDRSEPCETCESYTVLKTMAPHKWEWTGPDGRIYDVFDFPFTDTDGSTLILEMGIDITERKRAEEASRQAGLYARSLIEASLDPLVTISLDGKVMDVNKATELVTGVSREDLIGTDFSNYFTEPQKAKESYQEVFLKGSVRDYPLAIRHTSGHLIAVLYHATVFKNEAGEVQGVFAAARDVTERKRMEEELHESENRLRLLSSQLLTVQEAERKRIAREIHDSIGQTLAAIKFGLESKLSQMGAGALPPGVSIENIISLAQNGIEESRRIQMDLRPSVLDDLGILATIGWFTREFQKVYSHISVERQISVEENEIPDSLKTALFRVMQEAMNNVAKHSKADLVHLSLGKTVDKIELSIEDNGEGFDPENIKQGLGLTSMRERTELSGGTFEVESTVGKGTVIRASWPT